MLAEFGATYVVVGDSERRSRHREDGPSINAKVRAALRNHMTPVICVGEDLEVRRAKAHVELTLTQVDQALNSVDAQDVGRLLIAYEPVWAIGTGEVATPENAQDVCAAIRRRIGELHDPSTADSIHILYGGSVKPSTTASIVRQPDVDGALVGGASLDPEQLLEIWRAARLVL